MCASAGVSVNRMNCTSTVVRKRDGGKNAIKKIHITLGYTNTAYTVRCLIAFNGYRDLC